MLTSETKGLFVAKKWSVPGKKTSHLYQPGSETDHRFQNEAQSSVLESNRDISADHGLPFPVHGDCEEGQPSHGVTEQQEVSILTL